MAMGQSKPPQPRIMLPLVPTALFIFMATTPGLCANLVVNGSFEENPGHIEERGWRAGTTDLFGWAVLSGNVDVVGPYWTASHGDYSIDLTGNGDNYATIMQSLTTTPGDNYAVRFNIAANPDFLNLGAQRLRTGVFGLTETFHEYTVDLTGKTHTNMGWEEMTWYFTANSEVTLFYFQSISEGSAHGPALDNVRVTLVPELSSGSLATAGLLCAFLFRKRLLFRRSAQAA